MDIRYLTHSQIDKAKWDACIDASLNPLVYGCSWYLDIVCPGWEALVMDDYKAVMPLTRGKKYGINYLYQPFFTQQLGVFYQKESNGISNDFVQSIPVKFRYIDMNFNERNQIIENVSPSVNYLLNLNQPAENIINNYAENTRRNIKKAEKWNMKVVNKYQPPQIIDLFRNNKGREIEAFSASAYGVLSNLLDLANKRGQLEQYAVFSQDELVAGAFFMKSGNRRIFLFSGQNSKGKEKKGMFYLIHQFIIRNAGQDLILDFEGSNNAGLGRFYKGFGSERITYPHLVVNRLPRVVAWLKGRN